MCVIHHSGCYQRSSDVNPFQTPRAWVPFEADTMGLVLHSLRTSVSLLQLVRAVTAPVSRRRELKELRRVRAEGANNTKWASEYRGTHWGAAREQMSRLGSYTRQRGSLRWGTLPAQNLCLAPAKVVTRSCGWPPTLKRDLQQYQQAPMSTCPFPEEGRREPAKCRLLDDNSPMRSLV